jgi:hypothetical protein
LWCSKVGFFSPSVDLKNPFIPVFVLCGNALFFIFVKIINIVVNFIGGHLLLGIMDRLSANHGLPFYRRNNSAKAHLQVVEI